MGIAIDEGGIQFRVGRVDVDHRELRHRLIVDFIQRPIPGLLHLAHYEEPFLWSR